MLRSPFPGRFPLVAASCAVFALAAVSVSAQVFTVEPEHVEKHYTQFPPTNVRLTSEPMTKLTREELIRFLQSEQGFAMRPLPVGTLTLVANGGMEPSGDSYVDALHRKGMAAKAGDRLVVTNIAFHGNEIILDLNGGPEYKHKYLRHIAIGMGDVDTPLAQDDGTIPTGARIVLEFPKQLPDINGEQVEQLLKPMIDFGVKSQGEAYAESLPPFLAKAVKEHRVLIGMDHDMVLYAKGQPIRKIREQDNGEPAEIWVYGEQPQPVEFVRFSGNLVVRDEVARIGEPTVARTANEMGDYWGNQPVVASNQHEVKLGDRTLADENVENAPKSPPTLRNPGEKLPSDDGKSAPAAMAPVNFPKDQQRPGDPGYTPTVPAQQPAGGNMQTTTGASPQSGSPTQNQR
jgi:hypothetical protein